MSVDLRLLINKLWSSCCCGFVGRPKKSSGDVGKTALEQRLCMCCWLKPFFLTNIQSIMADIFFSLKKKNHSTLGSATYFFLLIYSNATSVQRCFQIHKSLQICAFFLHSLNAVCVSFSCVFCPSFYLNI